MPKLPSSADVQRVPPRIATDPGVTVPAGATETTLGIAAQELAPAAQALAEVAVRRQNRRDTVDRAGRINTYNREADDLLRNMSVEEDLSDERVLSNYAAKLTELRTNLLNEHQGSEDSRASLGVRLNDIEAAHFGRAAALSTKLGREKVLTTFDDGLVPLINRAGQDPTRETIDQLFIGLEGQLDDLRGALDPAEEERLREAGREQIALASLQSLMVRGHFETAEAMLDQGGLVNALTPRSMQDVRQKLQTARTTREGLIAKIEEAQAASMKFRGRGLSEEEINDLMGFDTTDRQREIQNLKDRGISDPLAEDIGNGNVRVVGPNNLGEFFAVNIVTNTSTPIVGDDADRIREMVGISGAQTGQQPAQPGQQPGQPQQPGQAQQPGQPPAQTTAPTAIEQAVERGTGPFAKMRAGMSNVFGPFIEGAIFEDTTDARQQIRIFSQTAKTRLIQNPRFPVAEQNIVKPLLPDADQFFKDPDTARRDLQKLKEHLIDSRNAKEGELDSKITMKRRGELFDQISAINEVLSLMEAPGEPRDADLPALNTQEEVDKLEPGTRFFWEPTGEPLIKD